jgi:hypothetical protein
MAALICCPLASAQEASPEPPAKPPEETLPQVEVNAQRTKLHEMRAQLVDLEDRFLAEYNKRIGENSVRCTWELPTGSRVRERVCRAAFLEAAERDEALGFMSGHTAPSASQIVDAKRRDYQKKIAGVVSKDPELIKMVQERDALEKRIETLRSELRLHEENAFVVD